VKLRRALNALLPSDIWVAAAYDMIPEFHARFSATSRRYAYHVGTDEAAMSPFRRRTEWAYRRPFERTLLDGCAAIVLGDHHFLGFAVRGTAPETDDHRCTVMRAVWRSREGGLTFDIEANRFLHHMVRFLVGTMLDIASGKRPPSVMEQLLLAPTNDDVSPPAPAHALFLEGVRYPDHLYVSAT
jgi:tRNA pseudouridine38-40 synthase